MVIKGRSRGNGKQLAHYLLGNKENDRAQVLDIRGTCQPQDLHRSLLEMSLTSELTKGVHGLYHAQINPAIGEDHPMSPDDWLLAADILEKHLEFEGQKRAIILHEKKGRVHGHVVWERYDHDTGKLRDDGHNYKKHDKAREEIEHTLQHEPTRQREHIQPDQREKKVDHKKELSNLWERYPDARTFVIEANKAGYDIAAADDRRPWRVITPDGEDLDLVRQLESAKTKDVREKLQPIRNELKPVADALEERRARAVQKEINQPDTVQDIDDSQDLAVGMLEAQKDKQQPDKKPFSGYSYSVTFKQSLAQRAEPALGENKAPEQDLSQSQDKAAALLEKHRQKAAREKQQQIDREQKMKEMREQAKQQTEKDITDAAAELLRKYRDQQEQRERDKNRGFGLDR